MGQVGVMGGDLSAMLLLDPSPDSFAFEA